MDRAELDKIKNICANAFANDKRIVNAWLFGSRARGDNREDSDYDILLTCDPERTGISIGFAALFEYQEYLEQELGNTVDIHEMNPYLEINDPDFDFEIRRDRILLYNCNGLDQVRASQVDQKILEQQRQYMKRFGDTEGRQTSVSAELETIRSHVESRRSTIPEVAVKVR